MTLVMSITRKPSSGPGIEDSVIGTPLFAKVSNPEPVRKPPIKKAAMLGLHEWGIRPVIESPLDPW
jgi:hypothetical protein